MNTYRHNRGFTIVELLIVIVVVGILAAITIVAYNGITDRAKISIIQSDLESSAKRLELYKDGTSTSGNYPSDNVCTANPPAGTICIESSNGTSYQYTYTAVSNSYCLTATNGALAYRISSDTKKIESGVCDGHTGPADSHIAWEKVASGGYHSCAISTEGLVYCWGRNNYGQLGNGNTGTNSAEPVPVVMSGVLAGRDVTDITAGISHTCVIADGRPFCWGQSYLGTGSSSSSNVPVAVNVSGALAGKTVTSIAAGNRTTCVIASGEAFCWGIENQGSLGQGQPWTLASSPIAVDTSGVLNGLTLTAIAGKDSHYCVLGSGQVYCWGSEGDGQLGYGTPAGSSSNSPIAVDTSGVLNGLSVTEITAGTKTTCAVAGGESYCWGAYYTVGESGIVSAVSDYPVKVNTSGVLGGKVVTSFSSGAETTCAIANDQRAYCWGGSGAYLGNNTGTGSLTPTAVYTAGPLGNSDVTSVSVGSGSGPHTCAVADATLYCWGRGNYGQLGDGTTTANSQVPVAVTPVSL